MSNVDQNDLSQKVYRTSNSSSMLYQNSSKQSTTMFQIHVVLESQTLLATISKINCTFQMEMTPVNILLKASSYDYQLY